MSVRSDNFAGERIGRLAQAGGQGCLCLVDRCVDAAVMAAASVAGLSGSYSPNKGMQLICWPIRRSSLSVISASTADAMTMVWAIALRGVQILIRYSQ